MAKKINGRLNIAIASLIIIIVGVASSRITDYANNKHETKDTAKDVDELKVDGCDPSGENRTNIAVIDTKLQNIKTDVAELRIEQRVDTKEILKAIRDNSP